MSQYVVEVTSIAQFQRRDNLLLPHTQYQSEFHSLLEVDSESFSYLQIIVPGRSLKLKNT